MEITLLVSYGNIGSHFLKLTAQEPSTKIKMWIEKIRLIENFEWLEKKGDFMELPGRPVWRGFVDRKPEPTSET